MTLFIENALSLEAEYNNTYWKVASHFKVDGEINCFCAIMVFYEDRTVTIQIGFVAMVSYITRNQQQQIQISKILLRTIS